MAENRKPKFFYGYIIASAGFIIMVIMWGALYSFGIFFKPLLAEFGWTRAATAGAYSLFFVLHGFLYIFTGRLTDKFGPRIITTICGFFFGLGFLLISQINAIWQFYLLYGVILAIGASGGWVPLASTLSRWFIKRRGLVIGIVVSGVGFGTVIMPPIANWLILSYGWRTSYIIVGFIALIVLLLAAQFLRRDPAQMGQLPYGVDQIKGEVSNLPSQGFSFWKAIGTSQFRLLCVAFFCFGFCLHVIMVHIAPYATDLGFSAIMAANILAIIGGLSIAGRITTGGAGDRIGNKLALVTSFILSSVALLWLLLAQEVWMLYLFAVVFGFAYGGWSALMSPMTAELFGLKSHGAILGSVIFVFTVGSAIGPVLAGRIFDITGSYQLAFLISAALSIAALILALLLRPISREGGTDDSKRSTRIY